MLRPAASSTDADPGWCRESARLSTRHMARAQQESVVSVANHVKSVLLEDGARFGLSPL